MPPTPRLRHTLAALLLCLTNLLYSQPEKLGLVPDKWADVLNTPLMTEPNSLRSLTEQLLDTDSLAALQFWDRLEAAGQSKGYYFTTRFCMTKADYLFKRQAGIRVFSHRVTTSLQPVKAPIVALYKTAIEAAYHTEDDMLIGWASFYSARLMHLLGETSWAVMYAKSGADLIERTGYNVEPTVYTWLAELLFDIREYDESMAIAQKAISKWANATDPEYQEKWLQEYHLRAWNILALNYQQRRLYDSARQHFDRALQIATRQNDTVWTGKLMVNTGRLLWQTQQYDTAHRLLTAAARYSLSTGIPDNAANAWVWAAHTSLAMGAKATALAEAREALRLPQITPPWAVLRDAYQVLSQIFRLTNMYDSALHYQDLYARLNDSLDKAVVTSSLAISKARLSDEINRYNIQKINREKENALLWRNFIIAFIIGFAVLALMMVNRRLLHEKLKNSRSEQEKQLLAQNMEAAEAQIQMFTANIIEKSQLISQMEQERTDRESSSEHHATLSSLSQLTILTEADWQEFKRLFEKAYPGFLSRLQQRFPDATLAEQRMAALIKLRLSGHQMAAILGISADSVRKSRQRLRQRFQVGPDANLEELVATL